MRLSKILPTAVAILLTALVAVLGVLSFQQKLATFQPLGFTAEAAQGAWKVVAVEYPLSGLQIGDEIYFVDGQHVNTQTALRDVLGSRPEAELVVKRDGALPSIDYRRPSLEVDVSYLVLTVIGLFYLLIGLYTTFKDPRGRVFLFFLWCLSSAALYILSPIGFSTAGDRLIFLGDLAARILLPALTLHLFLVFPRNLFDHPAVRRLLPLLYLPSLGLALFHADQIFGGPWLAEPASAATLAQADRLELLWLIVGSLSAVGVLWVRFGRQVDWEERRQTLWILLGAMGGYGPFVLFYGVPWLLGLQWPSWTVSLAVIPLSLVPLTFAWAILRYKLLDIGSILRDSVSYALTGLVGLFGFSMVNMAIRSGLAQDLALTRNLLTFAAGLGIAGVLAPTRNAIASGLEHLQYRGTLGQRQRLRDLGQELLHERDLDQLCATVVEHLGDAFLIRAELYIAQGRGPGSRGLVPVSPRPELPRELPFDAFGVDLWERESSAISPVDLGVEGLEEAGASPRQRLFAAGFRYALPLTVRGHRIGLALLSYKLDDEPLNSEDLDLTRGLLNQAALALENAQLLEEVHEKLQEVLQLEERHQGILESSPAGIVVLDEDDRVVSANHAFGAIVGIARRDTVGQPMVDLIPVTPLPEVGDGLTEVSYCELSGQEHHLQLDVAAYQRHSDSPLRVVVIQDISERIEMEKALEEKERLASLGMLAAGVAHEVNTPLTGISSYAQMLIADVDEDDPHHEILKKMERQTFRAAQIVNNLLEFSRNRRDQLHAVSLTAILGEATGLLEERASKHGVGIDWREPPEPMMVKGHDGELHQVFTNLVVNAIDAMAGQVSPPEDQSSHWVTVSVEALERRIRTRISDTGPGIPPERLERIFHPFFSSKMSKGGTGLGLAITYNIVRRHGGELRVENHTDGPGCTFIVDLPHPDLV